MDDNGNERKLLNVVEVEGRGGSWDFAQKFHTRRGRR